MASADATTNCNPRVEPIFACGVSQSNNVALTMLLVLTCLGAGRLLVDVTGPTVLPSSVLTK